MANSAIEGALFAFPIPAKAGGTINANTLVKLNSSGLVVNTGAGDLPLGWVQDGVSSGDYVAVYELGPISPLVAGGAITTGDYVKCGASGKVVVETSASTPTAFTIGQAADTTAADGDAIHVISGC